MNRKFLTALLPILTMSVSGHTDAPSSEEEKVRPQFIEYHNRVILFAPMHQGYERIKTDAFYVGVEGYAASVVDKGDNNILFDAELRMGYNFFFNGRDHVTPFAGAGYIQEYYTKRHHSHHKPGIAYGTLGFLYDHEFNTIFNLGVNAKLLLGGPVSDKHFDWGSFVVGTDLALPITFRFGHKRHWDYRIEPFYIYLHGSHEAQNYWGFRNSLGYRF